MADRQGIFKRQQTLSPNFKERGSYKKRNLLIHKRKRSLYISSNTTKSTNPKGWSPDLSVITNSNSQNKSGRKHKKDLTFSFQESFENHVSSLQKGPPVIDIPIMAFSPKNTSESYWKLLADSLLNPYTHQVLVKEVANKIKDNYKLEKAM